MDESDPFRPIKQEKPVLALAEELTRAKAENKKLNTALTAVYRSYKALRISLAEYVTRHPPAPATTAGVPGRKRNSWSDDPSKKTKTTTVLVKTEAYTVNDGYVWKKYGQKMTRDNQCPRAYFKCSSAPTCPVKKKIRSDQIHSAARAATRTLTAAEKQGNPASGAADSPEPCLEVALADGGEGRGCTTTDTFIPLKQPPVPQMK